MGRYNPSIPQILGQEWVPMREDPLVLTPQVNLVEVGHRFTLETSRVAQTARFYVQEYPPGNPLGQVILAAVYREGTEALTGPIRSVVIPCSLGTAVSGAVDFFPASSIAEALLNPSDNLALSGLFGSSAVVNLRFEVDSYAPLLNGKRILGVDFLYSADVTVAPTNGVFATITSASSTAIDIGSILSTVNPSTLITDNIRRIVIGEVDYHWNAPTTNIIEVLPWSFQRLRGFDNSSGLTDRTIQLIILDPLTLTDIVTIEYAAIEVFYCDETRLTYGGKRFTAGRGIYILGTNQLTMRDLTDTANPTLSAGNYSLVASSANQTTGNSSPYPQLNQIQQLYPILTHIPVRTVRPFPIDSIALGKTFASESTMLLPQLSLHASGGSPLTEVHVYGRQAVAQVYGTVTATQEILDSVIGAPYSYPWVRYYARRFGSTTIPLKLDSPTITGSSVKLLPSELDALDEIVDGWREITLRFDTPPTMGAGTNPQWRWSATGETVGNRWEVLGAVAPALSGITGNLMNLAPSPNQLSLATYGAPVSGANINLGWIPQLGPHVSATVDDQTADAALLFAQDLPLLTGFSSSDAEQEIVGIGLDCGLDPCCIPTEIDYVQLTWSPPQTLLLSDTFTRTASNGWGTAESGQSWIFGAGTPANFSVANGLGVQSASPANEFTYVTTQFTDIDMTARFRLDQTPTGNDIVAALIVRQTGVLTDYYGGDIRISTAGVMTMRIQRAVASVVTTLSSVILGLTLDTDAFYQLRLQVIGSLLRLRFWIDGEDEPGFWQLSTSDTTHTTGGVGILTVGLGGNTNVGAHTYWDDILAGAPWALETKVELQRMDTVETDWQTIMMASNAAISGFKDYEARVGIESSYRVRLVDLYDFPGPWSPTVTATVPAPGVTIGCDDGHLLIFTSNEEQDGSINLAYSSVWEQGRTVEEGFLFPESQFVQLQAMYNRDFFMAFRPMERGGEQFNRTVLVQAAAISPETLADFTSLRDMAWADVPYICVRDEEGNRWFATVLVPSGRVLRDRRLYLAPVDIIEVTDTPSQVDP